VIFYDIIATVLNIKKILPYYVFKDVLFCRLSQLTSTEMIRKAAIIIDIKGSPAKRFFVYKEA
jgi:hypothetical protein